MTAEDVRNYFQVDPGNINDDSFAYYGNPKVIKKGQEDRLKEITLEKLGFTIDRVKLELLGLGRDLTDPTTGKEYPDAFYEQMIDMAIATTEKEFDIVIRPRVNVERLDFNQTEYNSYMFLRVNERPIIQINRLQMHFNNQPIVTYPDKWIKVTNRYGQLEIQPSLLMQMDGGFDLTGVPVATYPLGVDPLITSTYGNTNFAPQMIGCTYIAGMLPQDPNDRGINREWYVHPDLLAYVAKLAAIEVLERWGRLILGAGIAGYSISIDGISSSVDSTQSAENTGSTADIKLIQNDMKDLRNHLKSYYGMTLGVLS